jgi:hypothetical protein
MTQDQIDYIYPLDYTVVKGDWIYKIARKYPIECLSEKERVETIIAANVDLLLPRSGLNSLGELLVGPDYILQNDVLTIPSYVCPVDENLPIDPVQLAEYTLCSISDGIIGVLQITQYPDKSIEGLAVLKNFPEGYVETYTFGSEILYNPEVQINTEELANKFLTEDLNPNLQDIDLSGDIELCNKLPYTVEGIVVSEACGTPIEGVTIEDSNGTTTKTNKRGEWVLKSTYSTKDENDEDEIINILTIENESEDEIDDFTGTLLPEFEVTASGLPTIPPRPPAYFPTPINQEIRTIPPGEQNTTGSNKIDIGTTPTPIETYNRKPGPLPIYESDLSIEKKRRKKLKINFPDINFPDINFPKLGGNKRKKPKGKRKLGWGFSWPSLPTNKKDRKKFLDNEKEKVKKERIKKKKEENKTPKGKKIKEKREKEKKIRIKKEKEKKIRIKKEKEKGKPNPNPPKNENSFPSNIKTDGTDDENGEPSQFQIPTISCGKDGWCRVELPLIGLNGLPRPSLGLIKLPPFAPNFPKIGRPEFNFPKIQMLSLKLPKIDFQMNLQVKMNKLITRIKTNLLPMIMLLLAKEFNICDAPKALDLKEAGVTDLGNTCPPNLEALNEAIRKKNRLTKILNNIYKFLSSVKIGVKFIDNTISIAQIALQIAKSITLIPATPAGGPPSASSNVVEKIERELKKYKFISSASLLVISIIVELLYRALRYMSLLDMLIGSCIPEEKDGIIVQESLSEELLEITQAQSQQLSPVVTNVNGFIMSVISVDSVEIDGTKRRQAIAQNQAGIIMLRGEASFSSNDQILIDELVYYIQENDLKAD